MHPKAAYCALHDLQPMRYLHSYGKGDAHIRIRWHKEDGEDQLIMQDQQIWKIEAGLGLSTYVTIDWGDITDAQYDALPQELIDRFLETG